MPVRKFRSVEGMDRALWREPGDPALARAIASTWEFAERTCPRRFPAGVYRHRSVEAAQTQRKRWEETDFLRFWSARGGLPPADPSK